MAQNLVIYPFVPKYTLKNKGLKDKLSDITVTTCGDIIKIDTKNILLEVTTLSRLSVA